MMEPIENPKKCCLATIRVGTGSRSPYPHELKDQYEKISTHTQNGAHFLENFHAFIKERALIEFEYADKLRKMARKYQPKKTRAQGQEDEETSFSTHVAFNKMLEEVLHLANQHDIISEELIQNIAKEIAGLVRELKDERKRLLGEGTKLQQNLQNCVAQMDKCQKAYGKAHREAEKAHEKYERAEKDMHLSRAEVEIAKQSSVAKNQLCEDAKADYAAQLQKTNDLQRMHFNEYMPRVFNDLQQMDERRITCIQSFMRQVAESQLKVEPIIQNCLNGIIAAAGGIDAVKDSERVVETYKSGFFPPDDFPFENLSEEKPNGASLTYSSSTSGVGHKDKLTIRGTLSGKTKKRNILANIFGQTNKNNNEDAKEETWIDLPPNQRKKKIQKKLKDVRSELEHETNQRDGLHKMRRTYEENPSLGDAASLNAESERCNRRIDSLHEQVQKLQSLLNEIESSTPDTAKRHSGHTRGNSIISEDTGSLSRSNSDESNIHNNSGTHRILSAAANAKNVLCKATNGISAVKHSLSRNNSASSGSTNSSQAVTPLTPTSPSTHSACLSAASGALLANMTNISNGSHGLVGDTSVSTCSGHLSPASNGHHHITPIEEEGMTTSQ